MNTYQLQVEEYLIKVGNSSVLFNEELMKLAGSSIEKAIRRTLSEEPNRPFSFRLSSIGRPLCQLQKEKLGEKGLPNTYSFPIKMLYGAIVESLLMFVLREAGLNVEEEQGNVKLPIQVNTWASDKVCEEHTLEIPGTFDLIIDGKVWDIKSCSPFVFENYAVNYEYFKQHDNLGYIPQLYGYAAARNIPAGGWIFVNKATGEIKFLECPDYQKNEKKEALGLIQKNSEALFNSVEFKRCFTAKNEFFRRTPTGNMVLAPPCTFCRFRNTCWPEARYLPSQNSKAQNPEYKYYTVVKEK